MASTTAWAEWCNWPVSMLDDDALRLAILGDDAEHVGAVVQRDLATLDRAGGPGRRRAGAAGRSDPGRRGRFLGATEQRLASRRVLTGERHTLRAHWSMMSTDTWARRYTLASRAW